MASMGDAPTATAAKASVGKYVSTPTPPTPADPPRPCAPAASPAPPSSPVGSQTSVGDVSCAICLEHAEEEELAMVKGCDHSYCVNCILRWAAHRERPTCPQCKQPFEHLFTYRRLDGGLHDFPQEESVTLLKRARWFTDFMLVADSGRRLLSADDGGSEWREYTPYQYPDGYDDDEAVEDYYMSSAAGRARVVFGNRRWGNSGYVAAGRQVARPSPQPRGKGKKGRCADANSSASGSASTSRASGSAGKKSAAGASPASAVSPAAGQSSWPAKSAPSAGANGAKSAPAKCWARGPPSGLSSAFAAVEPSAAATIAAAAALHSDAASGSSDSAATTAPAARVPAGAPAGTKPIPMRRQGGGARGWESTAAGASPPSAAGAAGGTPSGTSPGAIMGSCSSAYGSSPGGYMEHGLAPGRRARRAMRRAAEDGLVAGTTPPGGSFRDRRPAPVPDDWETAA